MVLPVTIKESLLGSNAESEINRLTKSMDSSADICRQMLRESDISTEILENSLTKPIDDVQILKQFVRVCILKDGKTFSFALYPDAQYGNVCNLKIYPRQGLEDGIVTPNIGTMSLPNVFVYIIQEMFQATNNIDDWKEFFVLCFNQYLEMILSED